MLIDGISLKGEYHDINQDSFIVRELSDGFIAVLSDGLGSKINSQYGSKALCESVVSVAEEYGGSLESCDLSAFLEDVHKTWINSLSEYVISSCYATLLAFVVFGNRGVAIRLGDGFIGIWTDNNVKILFDRKEDYFANETDCFTEKLIYEQFEIIEFNTTGFRGGIACSDGIGIGTMLEKELTNFTKDFIDEYCKMPSKKIVEEVKSWLADWPGTDDKTLVFCISERN